MTPIEKIVQELAIALFEEGEPAPATYRKLMQHVKPYESADDFLAAARSCPIGPDGVAWFIIMPSAIMWREEFENYPDTAMALRAIYPGCLVKGQLLNEDGQDEAYAFICLGSNLAAQYSIVKAHRAVTKAMGGTITVTADGFKCEDQAENPSPGNDSV